MEIDYDDLGNRFDCACKDVVEKLSVSYAADYKGKGPDQLSAFLELIQREYDAAEALFIRENKLTSDPRALQDIKAIAKSYARKCVEDYARVADN